MSDLEYVGAAHDVKNWMSFLGISPVPGHLYVATRAISNRTNQNYDTYPASELKKSYASFRGRPVFVNHANFDAHRTRGKILDSRIQTSGNHTWVELLEDVDGVAFPRLASEIRSGNIDSTSMGCSVESSQCSICHRVAKTSFDFCDHIAYMKGRKIKGVDGKVSVVHEVCRGMNFFEDSFVFDPADETALVQGVYISARLTSAIDDPWRSAALARIAAGEVADPGSPLESLLTQLDDECPRCGSILIEGMECPECQYIKPPAQFDDPRIDVNRD